MTFILPAICLSAYYFTETMQKVAEQISEDYNTAGG